MSGLEAVRLVAGRELRQAVRKKSLWAAFLVLVLGSTAAMILPEVLGGDGADTDRVVLVGDDEDLAGALRALGPVLGTEVAVTSAPTEAAASRLVEEGDADVAIADGDPPAIVVRSGESAALVGAARQVLATRAVLDRLEAAGLPPSEAVGAFDVAPAAVREVAVSSQSRRGAAAIISIVLYVLLLTGMVQVANGTAIEKSNRISEMLLPVVRPGSLLFGKVLGVGVVNVVILSGALAPIVVKFAVGGDLPNGIGGAIAASAAWFVLGLALYLVLAGMLGALVERQEEAGQAVSPLTALLIGTYVVSQSTAESTLGAVLAYVPLTSPIAEPTRIAIGASSPLEIVASLAVLIATIAVTARLASTVYARAIVRTGRRLRLRDVVTSP